MNLDFRVINSLGSIAFFELVLEILFIIISHAFRCNKPYQHCLSYSKAILTAGMEWVKCVWCLHLPLTPLPQPRFQRSSSLYHIYLLQATPYFTFFFSKNTICLPVSTFQLLLPFLYICHPFFTNIQTSSVLFFGVLTSDFFSCCLFVTSRIKMYFKTLLY